MTAKLIAQQMYTRERGGIFHATDGYDTIAISESLDKTFVKKYLHPFCMYHSPKSLTERGEKDPSLYPEALTLFQPETGDLVIGQAVFVPADFTGSRSTYFMHNYIIPSELKEEWIKQPERLFQWHQFQPSYDIELGMVLPEIDAVEYNNTNILTVKDELLVRLAISEDQFKQLLFAVMASISGKKKVFVSLDVPLPDYTNYARLLLELITVYLPYAHRRKLGAITFTSAPESKNYIHVTFFEPGTLNRADRSIEKQFIFDFAAARISGLDIGGQGNEYLDYALDHLSHSARIDSFLEFADHALSGLPEVQKLELSSYCELTDLFLTLDGKDTDHPAYEGLLKGYRLERFKQVELVDEILSIRLNELTITDILSLGENFIKEINFKDLKDAMVIDNYLIINALYEIVSDPASANTYNFGALPGTSRGKLRSTLKQVLRSEDNPEYFPLLFIAFETENNGVDYQGVWEYLIRNRDDETILSFIQSNTRLIDPHPYFKASLKRYLISHPESIWKNRTLRKELKLIKNDSLKNLLREVEKETTSPLVKFFKQHGQKL